MSGGVDLESQLSQLKNNLNEDANHFLILLDTSVNWLNSDGDNSKREEAYEIVESMKECLVTILGLIHDLGKNVKDIGLTSIGAKLAVKCIDEICVAISSDNEAAMIFSSELTSILFLLQPHLDEVTMRRYGGKLYQSAQICNARLKLVREGKIRSELIPMLISFQGFFSAYTHA